MMQNIILILMTLYHSGINLALAFCMGTDLSGIIGSPVGQPMAQIFYNSLGQKGALAVWCLVIMAQYVLRV